MEERRPKLEVNCRPKGNRDESKPKAKWQENYVEDGTGQMAYSLNKKRKIYKP
jgi:hypothetical protein